MPLGRDPGSATLWETEDEVLFTDEVALSCSWLTEWEESFTMRNQFAHIMRATLRWLLCQVKQKAVRPIVGFGIGQEKPVVRSGGASDVKVQTCGSRFPKVSRCCSKEIYLS